MKRHLNTLFITRDGVFLAKEGAAVEVRLDRQCLLRVPLLNLEGIVTLGYNITASPPLMAACAEAGVTISFCSPHGRFLAAVHGFTAGNVLLRRAQYRQADDPTATRALAAAFVTAKLTNCRTLLLRARRDYGPAEMIDRVATHLARNAAFAQRAGSAEEIRGLEGDGASAYFAVFPSLLRNPDLTFAGRVRRPPTDPVNALLSFCYSLLAHDCRSALETVGLDPAVGFLHRDRPGRPSLALDLMEEFRPVLADRCVFTLLNRRQLQPSDFVTRETGQIELREDARKTVLTTWQERKQEEIVHPFLEEKVSYGLLPFLQARLLARYLRADLDAYPAFLWR